MRTLVLWIFALAALFALSACSPSPYVRDPACQGAYDRCVRGCEMGAPLPTWGYEGMPPYERGCANDCYTDARACESRARDRRARGATPLPPKHEALPLEGP